MAKILFSGLVAGAYGRVGGSVYSRNRGGFYVKSLVVPTNPNTAPQSVWRGQFSTISQSWRGLTDAQRDTWKAESGNYPYQDGFGNTCYYSGFQLFCKLNSNLQTAGLSNLIDALGPVTFATPSVFDFDTFTTSSIKFILDFNHSDANDQYIISGGVGVSPGKNVVSKSYYFQLFVGHAVPTTTPNIISFYIARFGVLTSGQRIFFKIHTVAKATGQASIALFLNAIVP